MAKAQTLNFPKGASYMIPFQFRSPGNDVGDWTGWRCYFVVKRELTDPDTQALINKTIIADPSTGYNELLLTGTETTEYPVGRFYYQATVVDSTGTVGKSEIGAFIVEETTLLSDAGDYEGPDEPVGPPGAGEFTYGATRPIYLDINIVSTTGIAAGATANQTDAYLLARANHTGEQAISTITGLQAALDAKGDETALLAHINDHNNPHQTTKTQVGLPNVDNTADAVKNVLSATKLTTPRNINGVAFNGTANITIADATKEPTITAGTTSQYWRGDKTWQTLNKAAVGLPNVDNTPDSAKPISTAVQTALDGKLDKTATGSRIYGTSSSGVQITLPYSNTPTVGNVPQWTPDGNLRTGTPVVGGDTTPKTYVDVADTILTNVKSDKVDTYAVMAHGSNASATRPATYGGVIWRGTAEPVNRQVNDIWVQDDKLSAAQFVRNNSTSPSYELSSGGTTTVRRNLVINPQAANNSNGYAHNGGGGFIGDRQRVTGVTTTIPAITTAVRLATTTAAATWARIVWGTSSANRPAVTASKAHTVSALIMMDKTGTDAQVQFVIQYYDSAGAITGSQLVSPNSAPMPQGQWFRYSFVFTPPAEATSITVGVQSYTTANVAGAELWTTALMVEKIGAEMPYFDGSYNTWQAADLTAAWEGDAHNSTSILTGQSVGNIYGWPSNATNPVWLSTDRPYHGAKFARRLIVEQHTSYKSMTIPQDVTRPSGTLQTSMAMYRVSRAVPVSISLSNGGTSTPNKSQGTIAADTWVELRETNTTVAANSSLTILESGTQIGDLVDTDNHFNIDGVYTGPYFDGSTPGFAWSGTANASTSTGAIFMPMAYLPTSGGTINGNLNVNGTINGVVRLSGIGAPNGAVSGPLGARYTDLSAAYGVIEWVKAAGTGSTGWVPASSATDEHVVLDVRTSTTDAGKRYITATLPANYRFLNVYYTFRAMSAMPSSTPWRIELLDGSGNVLNTQLMDSVQSGATVTSTAAATNAYANQDVIASWMGVNGVMEIEYLSSGEFSYLYGRFVRGASRIRTANGFVSAIVYVRAIRIVIDSDAAIEGSQLLIKAR